MRKDFKKCNIIGIDLGGTKVSAGVVCKGKVSNNIVRLLPENPPGDSIMVVVDSVAGVISEIITKDTGGIGIGVPSVLDRKSGIIYGIQNIPSWKDKDIPLKQLLEQKFKIPIFINNDANCFALGEKLYGKGRPYNNFVGLTIGTGIGGGIICGGKLLPDIHCGSGEFGEMYYLDARVEDYCSSLFFKNKYKVEAKDLAKRAENGDKEALRIFEEFGYHLARAIKMIMFVIDPEAIIIGGSITKARKLFEESMEKELKNFTYNRFINDLKIEFTDINQFSPILGAAAVCIENLKEM